MLFLNFNLIGQTTFEKICNDRINYNQLDETEAQRFYTNVYTFTEKELDSLDLEILFSPNILQTFFLGLNPTEIDSLTYGLLYEKLLDYKSTPTYNQVRTIFSINKTIENKPADYANWEEDKKLFEALNIPKNDLEKIRLYIQQSADPSKTYKEVMAAYTTQSKIEQQNENTEFEKQLNNNSNVINMASLLAQSKTENKPIILYFTGQNTVNSKRLEHMVFNGTPIPSKLISQFIFVPLYVDNRKLMPENEHFKSSVNQQKVKTIGEKNYDYLVANFNIKTQPYLVALNGDNIILGKANYSEVRTTDLFNAFMDKALKDFEE